MAILHIMPDFSAGGLMREAVAENRIGNRVLPFPDDLSCGPIASDDPASRAAWWGTDLPLTSRFKLAEYDMEPRTEVARPSHPLWPRFPSDPFYAMAEIEPEVRAFWDELESTDAHIVLWFGRMAADELALYLAISERLAERDYSVVDVTALKGMERVATVQPEILTSLLGKERRPAPRSGSGRPMVGAGCEARMRRFVSSPKRGWCLRQRSISTAHCWRKSEAIGGKSSSSSWKRCSISLPIARLAP